jgi:tRNA(adenine34) deaminase
MILRNFTLTQAESLPMTFALNIARQTAAQDEVPVGAVVVYKNKIIAQAGNAILTRKDPTAHAEILVLQDAAKYLNSPRLECCDIYVTLEPCAMCAYAISLARIRRLYFGAYDRKGGGVEHGAKVFTHATCHHRPEVFGGILEQECGQLLKDYFASKR